MKTLITLLTFSIMTVTSFAQQQANLIVFSDDGKPFYCVINGIRQNAMPETNVKITDLKAEQHKVTIIFEDTRIPSVDKAIYTPFGMESTYRIKMTRKGDYKLRPFGEPVALASAPQSSAATVSYTPTERPAPQTGTSATTGGTTTTSTTTTTTNTGGTTTDVNIQDRDNGNSENVSMGVNVNGVGIDMNVNVSVTGTETGTTSTGSNTEVTYSETTTTTTTTSSSGNWDQDTEHTATTGTTTSSGCIYPVTSSDFAKVKSAIESKDFEDTKISTAKQVIKAKGCFSSEQIKELMMTFDFEDSRLEIAKYAYDFCSDRDNYFVLHDAFDFDSSTEELNEFLEQR